MKEYEEESINLLDGEVEVDKIYFGAGFESRRRRKRRKIAPGGVVVGATLDAVIWNDWVSFGFDVFALLGITHFLYRLR